MRRRNGIATTIALVALLAPLVSSPPVAHAGDRHPLWPSELEQIGAPLRAPDEFSESERLAAVRQLENYATPLILPHLDVALEDPAVPVQRWALELCLSRQLVRCDATAKRLWESGEQASLRTTAISVLALDPVPERAEILFAAMREDGELMRAHAAFLVGEAPLDETMKLRARRVLATKLADASPRVRRAAAASLGRLGPGEGALALVRLLDDPDLAVREAAAEALGALEDPRAAPPLKRVLESAPSDQVARKSLAALARLSDPTIDGALLSYLDAPPSNLSRTTVVKAIGKRRHASEALLEGLVERLRESDIRADVLRALRWQGDAAVSALEKARSRGLEPSLRLEVDRLLAARTIASVPASTPTDPTWPGLEHRRSWELALEGSNGPAAAAAIVESNPEWLPGAVSGALSRAGRPEQASSWLLALTLAESGVRARREDAAAWNKVVAWSQDRSLDSHERCLAAMATAGAAGTRHAELVREQVRALAGSRIRACVAASLRAHGEFAVLEALLADPDPLVRASATLAHAHGAVPASHQSRLSLMARTDSDPRVRELARWVLDVEDPDGSIRPGILEAVDGGAWMSIVTDGRELGVPTVFAAGRTVALVPSSDARISGGDDSPIVPIAATEANILRGLH